MNDFTHLDADGASRMVDIGDKPVTRRTAVASCRVRMAVETLQRIRDEKMAKGNVLEVARLAGIMAAKRTGEWIPLCHPLPIDSAEVSFSELSSSGPSLSDEDDCTLGIESRVSTTAKTGVEMEAMVAVSAAALTIYDMCKAIDRAMVVEHVRLEEKAGGASGNFRRDGLP
jgi:cyclic pyranopterin phosphate synthase